MNKTAIVMIVSLAVVMVLVASPDTAAGRHGKGRVTISGGGLSFVFGAPPFSPDLVVISPSRGRFGRYGHFRRGSGGVSLFLRFGTGHGHYGIDRSHGRRYGYSPPYQTRTYRGGYGDDPYRGRRVWIPGRVHEGRYRSGYWEHRHDFEVRHDGRRDRGPY